MSPRVLTREPATEEALLHRSLKQELGDARLHLRTAWARSGGARRPPACRSCMGARQRLSWWRRRPRK